MPKLKLIILYLLCWLPLLTMAQSFKAKGSFLKFVSKTYRVPEELRYDCKWNYAIVKIETDGANKIIKYDFFNDPTPQMKESLKFLIGYRFPKSLKINHHPIVFYLSIDNSEICKPKEGEQRFYAPNQIIGIMANYLTKILRADPKSIILPNLVIEHLLPDQQ